jgi:predicted transposase YbfD/YdcC
MDQGKYTTVMEALAAVPDPRKARGKRYPWALLLSLVSAALASGERSGRGIGQWVREQAEGLAALLGRPDRPLPSEATLRRAVRAVDVAALEERLGAFEAPRSVRPADAAALRGLALDGKEVRGTRAHGVVTHLLSLARHDGTVLGEMAVASKANEITAAPQLLAGRDLAGCVVTADALLAHQSLARQIRQQRGHYLLVIKDNQPETRGAIAALFASEPAEHVARTVGKGHGRIEERTLEASTELNAWLTWPEVGQVLRRTCRRVHPRTGEVEEEVTYGLTSLRPREAGAATLEALWRGHWSIENRVHYPRDVSFGEDAGHAYRGQTPHALAALRNALLGAIRAAGWASIADALRHYGASPERALALIGALPTGL